MRSKVKTLINSLQQCHDKADIIANTYNSEMFNRIAVTNATEIVNISKDAIASFWGHFGSIPAPKNPMKMYILILDWVDTGHAVNTAAHAALIAQELWNGDPEWEEWLCNSFRKVSCIATQAEFEKALSFHEEYEYGVITESSFGDEPVALVFKPRYDWDPFFKSLKLYGACKAE